MNPIIAYLLAQDRIAEVRRQPRRSGPRRASLRVAAVIALVRRAWAPGLGRRRQNLALTTAAHDGRPHPWPAIDPTPAKGPAPSRGES
jgi:hypothetical protein